MSDDEKYQIIGKVVSDHEAAKRHLAALQAGVGPTTETLIALLAEIAETRTRIVSFERQRKDLGV